MTVAELIESLMTLPLDAEINFWEQRYCGGGDEGLRCNLAVVQEFDQNYFLLTPEPDRNVAEQDFGKTVMILGVE